MRSGRLVVLSFLLVLGCDAGGAKAPPPLMPTSGDSESSPRLTEPAAGDGEEEGTLVADNEAEPAPCGVSFTKDVMPKLVATCGTAACHSAEIAPSVDEATPQITHEALIDFGFDDPTWADPHPTDSKLAEPALKAAIDGWRECGAPFE